MAGYAQVSLIPRWSGIHIIVFFLWMYASLSGGNVTIPIGKMEKGFLPSASWLEETSNKSMVQEETKLHEQKAAYQNQYLQYPSPQIPPPVNQVNPWTPATPSTLPPPPPNYSVIVSIQQPEAIIILCQVQEPLEHISWLWYPCPNHHSAGNGMLIADGTTVSNASLYGVRILGQNGVFTSELHILQNPLQPGVAGLYRCEAWPHGATTENANQQTSSLYHDDFIIGGHLMVKSCFYEPHKDKYYYHHYGPTSYNHKMQKSYRSPRNEAVPDVSTNMIDGYSETNSTQAS